jgi:polyketide biosynthesis 3-hydroxy-3-methylglutaryl-CoA synthase-like enzyme PksG
MEFIAEFRKYKQGGYKMKIAGIEALNAFAGSAYLNVEELAIYRKLDTQRFANLLMKEKTAALPYEDPITFGVNAAKPIIDKLSQQEKDRIELVITGTESAFDFGKSMSTYFHKHLGLNRNCRLFELKNACYSGVAGVQMGINFVLSQVSPGAKALIIATDISRFMAEEGGEELSEDWSFAEPSGGAGAVAILVSEIPKVFQIDIGANGYYGYEVMDTCRPVADSEAGDADLSLLSYLDCSENAYLEYQKRVEGADYQGSFQYLAFHTPFGGMIKGAHRNIMRKMCKAEQSIIDSDFNKRVMPGLTYCQRVGNIMGATTMLSLFSTIANGDFETPKRIGCFSYGSGCCSEFFSGLSSKESQKIIRSFNFEKNLDERYKLNMDEYQQLLLGSNAVRFGTRNVKLDWDFLSQSRKSQSGQKRLYLKEIREFHREYEWA